MLFHTFRSQEERRKFGGSYFIEVQYCKLAQDSEITKIVSVDVMEHCWLEKGKDYNGFYVLGI